MIYQTGTTAADLASISDADLYAEVMRRCEAQMADLWRMSGDREDDAKRFDYSRPLTREAELFAESRRARDTADAVFSVSEAVKHLVEAMKVSAP